MQLLNMPDSYINNMNNSSSIIGVNNDTNNKNNSNSNGNETKGKGKTKKDAKMVKQKKDVKKCVNHKCQIILIHLMIHIYLFVVMKIVLKDIIVKMHLNNM